MKSDGLLDAQTARTLGFDWLRSTVEPASRYGLTRFEILTPFRAGEEALARARAESIVQTGEALGTERLDAVRRLLLELPDVSGLVARASLGDVLADPDFFEIRRFCELVERLQEVLAARAGIFVVPADAAKAVRELLQPGRSRDAEFYLSDAFDPSLATVRQEAAAAQAELEAARGRERTRVARELRRDELSGDEFILMRADLTGPLPHAVRVVREAPTYFLCALEYGDNVTEALARRDAASQNVAVYEEGVRARLSEAIGGHGAELQALGIAVGEVDVTIAAARFARTHECVAADVVTERVLEFEGARFPPVAERLAREGRAFVALDLDLDTVAVLTGPNMGGKTVTLQTCGFVALCAVFGFPVPARRARVALFERIAWLGTGGDEPEAGLLSSFAGDVLALKATLAALSPRTLLLADEFARTTTPLEGRALLVALVERLRERGACALLATHLSGIAAAAEARHFAVRGLRSVPAHAPGASLEDILKALAAAMDYTIAEVTGDAAAPADAIALTALLGVDPAFVDSAYRALAEHGSQ